MILPSEIFYQRYIIRKIDDTRYYNGLEIALHTNIYGELAKAEDVEWACCDNLTEQFSKNRDDNG